MTDESADERRTARKEALEKCSETVNRAMVSLLAVSLFCLLTTFGASDRSLVAPEPTIKVPFADVPISFARFIFVAPILLFVLTTYLHVFYGHWGALDRERRAQGLTETYPTLFSIDSWIGCGLTELIFYWLAPLVVIAITWKAAARFEWGLPLAVVAVLLTAGLVFLQIFRREPGSSSRRMRALSLGVIVLLMLAAVTVGRVKYIDFRLNKDLRPADYWERSLDLARADLKTEGLAQGRFRHADLSRANLSGANLFAADLSGADLSEADLSAADLSGAHLSHAKLRVAKLSMAKLNAADLRQAGLSLADLRQAELIGANLRGANLSHANFSGANLSAADLSGANLTQANLTQANLTQANLTQTKLSQADLSGANIGQAILRDVNLRQTDLSNVIGLTCEQVRAATTDKSTKLPGALKCTTK